MAEQGLGGPEIWIRGPVAPPAPPQGEPPHLTAAARRFAWVATHGGAGTTTLATVFGGHDAGRGWPRPEHGEPESVLLVARTHATGLDAVAHTLDVFRRGDAPPGLDLNAVVLVADAPGRLPRQLAQHIDVLTSVVDVYRVPWVNAWRINDLTTAPPRETVDLARLTGTVLRQEPPAARR